ncbi:hypothetical protein B4U80_01041 [Leptotrombidium deliense]|uniref:Uncharacterized protein n=1 Tax=Leptotrombidium deliense TaxID=299467 RepID=A0A443SRP9_9ACAR|nr:hypothetical protein B4U80_01041 [Leptotrombidium deliense]
MDHLRPRVHRHPHYFFDPLRNAINGLRNVRDVAITELYLL